MDAVSLSPHWLLILLGLLAMGSCRVLLEDSHLLVSESRIDAPMATGQIEDVPLRSRVRRQVADHKMTAKEIQQVVDTHNFYRAQTSASNMRHMVWNADLARMAYDWGQQCRWEHGQPDYDLYPEVKAKYPFGLGQNLYTTYSIPNRTVEENILTGQKGWYDEVKDYDFNTKSCTPGAICGHYTQMVWANSYELGCAHVRCPRMANLPTFYDAFYLVCNYGPPGNYIGQRPYRPGPGCTQCPPDAPFCTPDGALCTAELLTTTPEVNPSRSTTSSSQLTPRGTPSPATAKTSTYVTSKSTRPSSNYVTSPRTPLSTTFPRSTTTPSTLRPTSSQPSTPRSLGNDVCPNLAEDRGSVKTRSYHFCGLRFSDSLRHQVARRVNRFCQRFPARCCQGRRRAGLPRRLAADFTRAEYVCHDACSEGSWLLGLAGFSRVWALEAPDSALCAQWRGHVSDS